jgi:thiosulfate/3-mercaptopyruvate sulfurtransferase
MHPLISAKDAIAAIAKENTVVFDVTYHLPGFDRDAEAEYLAAHIPGARRFDINEITAPESDLPHTMPTAQIFQRHMQNFGVSRDSHVLVYDDSAVKSAARAWYMFRYFGHEKTQLIDGGLAAWRTAGGEMESGEAAPPPAAGDFTSSDPIGTKGMISVSGLKELVDQPPRERSSTIIDARPEDRFLGTTPEPRPGLAAGHMPGAVNIPFPDLFDTETGCYKPPEALEALFADIDTGKGVITTCGSGVTACAMILALTLIGRDDLTLYDGSWAEWGSREDCPVSV